MRDRIWSKVFAGGAIVVVVCVWTLLAKDSVNIKLPAVTSIGLGEASCNGSSGAGARCPSI